MPAIWNLGAKALKGLGKWVARGTPEIVKGRFKLGKEKPGVFRANPFRGPKRTVNRPGRRKPTESTQSTHPWRGRTRPPEPRRLRGYDKGGIIYRNPGWTMAGLGAGGAAYGLSKYLAGDESTDKPGSGVDKGTRDQIQDKIDAKEYIPPSIPKGQRMEYLKRRRKRINKGLNRILNQFAILSFMDADSANKFMESALKMLTMDQELQDDNYSQGIINHLFPPDHPEVWPKTGRAAYTTLLPLIGDKEAGEIAGNFVDTNPKVADVTKFQKKETMEMMEVWRLAKGNNIGAAAERLATIWISDPSRIPQSIRMTLKSENIMATATAWVQQMVLGGATIDAANEINRN